MAYAGMLYGRWITYPRFMWISFLDYPQVDKMVDKLSTVFVDYFCVCPPMDIMVDKLSTQDVDFF